MAGQQMTIDQLNALTRSMYGKSMEQMREEALMKGSSKSDSQKSSSDSQSNDESTKANGDSNSPKFGD